MLAAIIGQSKLSHSPPLEVRFRDVGGGCSPRMKSVPEVTSGDPGWETIRGLVRNDGTHHQYTKVTFAYRPNAAGPNLPQP